MKVTDMYILFERAEERTREIYPFVFCRDILPLNLYQIFNFSLKQL